MLSIPAWVGLGLVVVFFGTWGDLVESLLKRTLGVKDSGNILPGHGGMLDRFDSSLLAIPAAVVYLYTLTFLDSTLIIMIYRRIGTDKAVCPYLVYNLVTL